MPKPRSEERATPLVKEKKTLDRVASTRPHRIARKHPYKSIGLSDGSGLAVHRFRAERALGYKLPRHVIVHHADGSTDENAPLVICENGAYHKLLHARMRIKAAGGNPNTDAVCKTCLRVKPKSEFSPQSNTALGVAYVCKPCAAEWQRTYRQSPDYRRPERKAS